MIRLISIDNVFNFIAPSAREQVQDDDQIVSWAYQRYRTSENAIRYVKDIAVVPVEGHLGKVPDGATRIWKVVKLADDIQITPAEEDEKGAIYPDETIDQARRLIYHDMVFSDELIKNRVERMRYAGVARTDNFVRNQHEHPCKLTYSLTSDNCHFRVDFPEGQLLVEFFTNPVDSHTGRPLLPEKPMELWQGLGHFCEAQLWRDRVHLKEEAAFTYYQKLLQMSNQYMREANAYLTGKHLRSDMARHQIHGPARILNIARIAHKATV